MAPVAQLGKSQAGAVSISFLTLAFAQLWHVFNMRTGESNFIRNEITQNPYVWGALALTTGLLLGAVYVPFLAEVLSVVNPETDGWALLIGASLFPWLIGQIMKGLR